MPAGWWSFGYNPDVWKVVPNRADRRKMVRRKKRAR